MHPAGTRLKWVKVIFQIMVWTSFFIAMAGMSWAALASDVPIPTYFPQQDKLSHLAGFFVLGALLALGLGHRFYVWALAFCLVLSLGVEIAQRVFTTTREYSLEDAVASALGAFIGLSLVCLPLWIAALISQKRLRPAPRTKARRASIDIQRDSREGLAL
jgi:VanZ family protein